MRQRARGTSAPRSSRRRCRRRRARAPRRESPVRAAPPGSRRRPSARGGRARTGARRGSGVAAARAARPPSDAPDLRRSSGVSGPGFKSTCGRTLTLPMSWSGAATAKRADPLAIPAEPQRNRLREGRDAGAVTEWSGRAVRARGRSRRASRGRIPRARSLPDAADRRALCARTRAAAAPRVLDRAQRARSGSSPSRTSRRAAPPARARARRCGLRRPRRSSPRRRPRRRRRLAARASAASGTMSRPEPRIAGRDGAVVHVVAEVRDDEREVGQPVRGEVARELRERNDVVAPRMRARRCPGSTGTGRASSRNGRTSRR